MMGFAREFWFNANSPMGRRARVVVTGFDAANRVKEALRNADFRCGNTSSVTIHFTRPADEIKIAQDFLDLVKNVK